MALIQALRRRQTRIARAVTVLFAVSWLGLAVQPCVAGAAGPEASHAGHAGMGHAPTSAPESTAGHGCPHCPPQPSAGQDCGTGVALECDAIGALVLPGKDPGAQVWFPVLLGAAPTYPFEWTAGSQRIRPADPGAWRPPDRPLHQRFCTYLK